MRGTDLLDKMELVDPAFVEEADQILKHKKLVRVRLSALAACLVLLLCICLWSCQHMDRSDHRPRCVLKSKKSQHSILYYTMPRLFCEHFA